MKVTNFHGVPDVLVRFLERDSYSKGAARISVTRLIDSPRISILQSRHDQDIEVDVVDNLWMIMGKAMHHVLETGAADHQHAEERLFAEVDGWTISGAVDLQTPEDGGLMIEDFKLTSVYSLRSEKIEWVRQLNCYSWLARKVKGVETTRLRIIAVLRDWSRAEAQRTAQGLVRDFNPKPGWVYPLAPVQIVDIPLWSFEEQDDYIRSRVKAHQEAAVADEFGDVLAPCTNDERWRKEDSWAVFKYDNKRATRVFDNKVQADGFAAGVLRADRRSRARVVERPGGFTRCDQNYCRVARFCDRYQREKELEPNNQGAAEGGVGSAEAEQV